MAKLKKIDNAKSQSATFEDVKSWYNVFIHPNGLDTHDEHVFKHVYHGGRWAGIFQVTQAGAQKFFERAKPENVVDIASLTSIYRPGPLAAKVDDLYLKAKADPASVVYEHPLIKECLESTHGTIIFQEQLMKLGHVVGGLSLDECDKLRKVITKRSVSGASKAKEEAKKLEAKFIEGAIERGIEKKIAEDLFERIAFFSGYGFNFTLSDDTFITIVDQGGSTFKDVRLKDVRVGDVIMTRDESSMKNMTALVKDIHDHGEKDVFRFEMDDGSFVECSMKHKFRTTCGKMLPIDQIVEEGLEIVALDINGK